MNAKDAIRQSVEFCQLVTRMYIDDLSDADLLVRAVPGTNHIAWQLGHLLRGTHQMLTALGQPAPSLPAGFLEAYTKETAGSDDPHDFAAKAQYLALIEAMNAAVLAAIAATPETALEQPGPEAMRDYAPTVAAVLLLLGNHWLMHAGQYVPIRRKLGRAPLF
jgi:hypothetical protein